MVVDIPDDAHENGWDDDEEFKVVMLKEWTVFKGLPEPISLEEQYLQADPPDKKRCDVCGKDRVQVRCADHLEAKGCNFCHLRKEHRA
jgi:hypothetical protein